MMQELIPFSLGLVLGSILGFVRPTIRLHVGAACAIVLGTFATVVSGEFMTSWAYLLVDIPLVAGATFVGLVLAARVLHPMIRRS